MFIFPSNQAVPITADFSAPGLFIGLLVYDMVTGSPVQITGQPGQTNGVYPMSAIGSSNSYQAKFQGKPEHPYLFIAQQFTDGTYTTPSGNSQSQSGICKALPPLFTNGLMIQIGCQQQPNQQPVIAAQNGDINILLSFFDEQPNPNQVDITAASTLTMSILESDGVTVLIKSLGTDISLVPGAVNQALVSLKAADLALLAPGENDANVQLSLAGVNYAFNLYAALLVQQDSA